MKTNIFIPTKINVGFQKRKDTYTSKLAYVIYFDEKGKLRKETSWQSWRDEGIPNEIYDNEPMEGFVLNKKVGGDRYGWNPRQTYTRVYDPRGFEFEITIPNLLWILENCNCIKGKGLEGEFVYGWDGKELVLVPVESSDYKEIQEKNKVIHNNTFIKARDLIIGATYEDLNGNQYVYMGKSKPWKDQSNYYYHESHGYYYSNNRKEGYEYPLDDTWLISKCRSSYYNQHLTYYRSIQEEKNEFFFILLGNPSAEYSWHRENRVTHMKTITRKFTHMVLEKRPDYPDMVNLLYSNAEYCQEDFEADKLIDLPYDIFVAMTQETIEKCLKHNWYGDDFVVGKEKDKLLDNRKVYYEKESGKWYIMDTIIETYEEKKWFSSEMETKTREREVKKYFDNLEECYQYIHPIYGEHYLKNGYLERRFYYGTEK